MSGTNAYKTVKKTCCWPTCFSKNKCNYMLSLLPKSWMFRCLDYISFRNRRFTSCLGLCFKASPSAKPFIWKLVKIHTQIVVHLHVNKTDFHMKGFALGLALKQRRNATRKSPIDVVLILSVVKGEWVPERIVLMSQFIRHYAQKMDSTQRVSFWTTILRNYKEFLQPRRTFILTTSCTFIYNDHNASRTLYDGSSSMIS